MRTAHYIYCNLYILDGDITELYSQSGKSANYFILFHLSARIDFDKRTNLLDRVDTATN